MKTIVVTAALVVAFASPVMAQHRKVLEPRMGQPFAQSWQDPAQAYARSGATMMRPRSSNPAWDVYDSTGEYIGSDPDPLIRFQLQRDPPSKNDD